MKHKPTYMHIKCKFLSPSLKYSLETVNLTQNALSSTIFIAQVEYH